MLGFAGIDFEDTMPCPRNTVTWESFVAVEWIELTLKIFGVGPLRRASPDPKALGPSDYLVAPSLLSFSPLQVILEASSHPILKTKILTAIDLGFLVIDSL